MDEPMVTAFFKDPGSAPDDSCIADMRGIAFVAPQVAAKAIEMTPFTSQAQGIRGVAPAEWKEAAPGAYVRGASAVDETALVMDSAPVTAEAMLRRLAGRLGFDPQLKSVAREELGGLTWDFYRTGVQGLALDLALAEAGGRAHMALLVARPDERDALYEQVFRPAVEALAPLR